MVIKLTSPFIVVSGSSLILHRNGVAEPSVRVIPDLYHALKDITHLPCAIYLQLDPLTESGYELTEDEAKQMTLFKTRIDAARNVLPSGGYTPEELTRQNQILEASENIVDQTLKTKRADKASLTAFTKSMGPLMLSNAWDAGCAQVQGTHAQVMKWKAQLSKDEWNRVIVINVARHQARIPQGRIWGHVGDKKRVVRSGADLKRAGVEADCHHCYF